MDKLARPEEKIEGLDIAALKWVIKGAGSGEAAFQTLYIEKGYMAATNGSIIYGVNCATPRPARASITALKGYLKYARDEGFAPTVDIDAGGVFVTVPGRENIYIPAADDAPEEMPYVVIHKGQGRKPLENWKTVKATIKTALTYVKAPEMEEAPESALYAVRWGADGVITAGSALEVYQGWCGDALYGTSLVLSVPLARAISRLSQQPTLWICDGTRMRVCVDGGAWVQGAVTGIEAFDDLVNIPAIFEGINFVVARNNVIQPLKNPPAEIIYNGGGSIFGEGDRPIDFANLGNQAFTINGAAFSRLAGQRAFYVDRPRGMLWWKTDIERGACIIKPSNYDIDLEKLDSEEEPRDNYGPEGL